MSGRVKRDLERPRMGLLVAGRRGRVDRLDEPGQPEAGRDLGELGHVIGEDHVAPAGLAQRGEHGHDVVKQRPGAGGVDEARAGVARHHAGGPGPDPDGLVGGGHHGLDRPPPGLGVGELGVGDLVAVPGKPVAQERAQLLGANAVAGHVLVERLDHGTAPHPGSVGEGAVEVPQDQAIAHRAMMAAWPRA